jgi:hypothetical protein
MMCRRNLTENHRPQLSQNLRDCVVPELRKRGIFGHEYTGTLRYHLGCLTRRAHMLPAVPRRLSPAITSDER